VNQKSMRARLQSLKERFFTLRVKLGLLTTIGVLILLTLYYSILSYFIVHRLAELDKTEALNNMNRVMLAGQQLEDHLDAICFGLAVNDVMYEFAESGDTALVERKLSEDIFRMADLSVIYICKNDGTALWSRTYDSATQGSVEISEFPASGLPPDFALIVPPDDIGKHWDGFLRTSAGPLQVVCRPILTGVGEGPIRGTVIVGRLADQRRIDNIKRQTQVEFELQDPLKDLDRLELPFWIQVSMTRNFAIGYPTDDLLRAHGLITDTRGFPLMMLSVDTPKTVGAAAASVMQTSVLFTVMAALAIIGILVYFVHHLVEIPLQQIGAHMQRIEATADPRVPFPYHFSGEFGRLAKSLTHMLNRLGEAQASLRDSELRFRSLTDSAMDGIVSADASARIISWNKGAERMFGYTAAEVVGKPLSVILPERIKIDPADVVRRIEEHIAAGPGHTLEFTGRRKDGSEFPLDMSAGAWDAQEGRFYSGILRDTTLRKQTLEALENARDAAEASNRAKTQFLASMSHEIRTPMNGVVGMTEILAATDLAAPQRRCVEGIRQSADALLDIINDVLDLSKIEADRVELEKIPFNPVDLLQQIVWSLQPAARKKQLELSCVSGEGLPEYTEGDPARIRQILVNLVGNAIKFTEEGSCEATLVREIQGDGAMLHFAVKDTGIGIDPSIQDVIFERFSQADASITRKYGGTGLGLTICRRLAELMGGRVWVQSTPGRGSTFHFTLPARPCGPPQVPAGDDSSFDLQVPMRRLKVLVAEDTKMNQDLFVIFLEGLGHDVHLVENGQQAIEALARDQYDVVLMDVEMPVMDGMQATRLIRKPETGTLDPGIPVIAVTAHALIGDRERFLEAGMNDYVSKPIDFRGLRMALLRATAGRDYVLEDDASARTGRLLSGRADALARLGGSENALLRMDAIFREDAPSKLEDLLQGIAARDIDAARRAAHSLKNMSATIGAMKLSQIAADIEAAATGARWHYLDETHPRLAAALDAALRAVAAGATPTTPPPGAEHHDTA
jgi:PAS domain S-box-containing protein